MKKTILLLVVLALLVPASAFAATEFSLGGFIKLDTIWDSTQNPKTANVVINRNNDPQFQHGHFLETAQGTRFNFTIKGPTLWGASTTGFIEGDFDGSGDIRQSATSSYLFRLRHAMFRLNWPETELMFGQYWGMFSEFAPEAPGDADFASHGWFLNRTPQIRLTQKFAGSWTVAGAVAKAYDPTTGATGDANFDASTSGLAGGSSETPQFMGKVAYEQDLWGKAPFYGRPRGFTAQLTGGWQRTRYQSGNMAAANTFGQNAFGTTNVTQNGQMYLDPWCVQGTLFIPVLPTYSNNLAGSASVTAQYFIGQGVSAWGGGRDQDNSWFNYEGIANINGANVFMYDRKLMNQYGGTFQGQYWFNNQWYLNAVWGFIRDYGINQGVSSTLARAGTANSMGYMYASNSDQAKLWSEYNLTLWYRPVEALKFGLTYSFENTYFLQKQNNPAVGNIAPNAANIPSAGAKDYGESHRIEFTAWMFF